MMQMANENKKEKMKTKIKYTAKLALELNVKPRVKNYVQFYYSIFSKRYLVLGQSCPTIYNLLCWQHSKLLGGIMRMCFGPECVRSDGMCVDVNAGWTMDEHGKQIICSKLAH